MPRGKAAAEEPKKKKREEVKEEEESEREDAEAGDEDDKENQQPNGGEEEEKEDGDEEEDGEDETATKGKRKKSSSESSSAKKSKSSSAGGDAHSVVLAYMQRMNRPYSAINVADNMQGALSKSQTVKVLEDLTADGRVTAKEFGKSKVFFATQKDQDTSGDEMGRLDRQLAEVTEQLNKARSATVQLQAEVQAATAEPDDDALDAELAELEQSVPAMEKKLAAMKAGKAMPAADVDALQRQFNGYLTEWKKRRKGCRELIGMVAENAAKSWKEKNFCEDQGIETDEAVKVKLDEWQEYYRDVKPLPKEVKGKGKKK